MKIRILTTGLLFLLFVYTNECLGQIQITGAGTGIGVGSMSAAGARVTAYSVTPGIQFRQSFAGKADMRLQFVYVRDLNAIIPDTKSARYFSYVYGASLSVYQLTPITGSLGLNFGLGALVLHDKTFDDISSWGAGFTVHARLEHALSDDEKTGLKLGAGAEYGQVFTTNSPGYFIYQINVQWMF